MSRSLVLTGLVLASTILLAPLASAAEGNAIAAPAAKAIGRPQAAASQIEPALIVLNAKGASLKDGKLVLTGVSSNAIMFADRPVRAAGHVLTSVLLDEWNHGDSFAKDPPNATVSVLSKAGDDVKDAVVTLTAPKLEGADTLTFDVTVLEGALAGGDGPASVFIDIIGMPFTPLSYAGVARRTARRTAWYGAAAYGAAAAGAAAGAAAVAGAAAAAPYYHPMCGYYPYPPCY